MISRLEGEGGVGQSVRKCEKGGGYQGNVISHFLPLSGFGEGKKRMILKEKNVDVFGALYERQNWKTRAEKHAENLGGKRAVFGRVFGPLYVRALIRYAQVS